MVESRFYYCGVVALMCALAACDDSTTEQSCRVSADCPLPLVCYGAVESTPTEPGRNGRCIQECRVDSDCQDGLCIDSVCGQPGRACRTNSECVPFGQSCDPGTRRCVSPCAPNGICPEGTRCSANQCIPFDDGPRQDAEVPARRDAQVTPVRDARVVMNDAMAPRADMRPPPRDMRPPMADSTPPPPVDMGVVNRGNGQYGDRCRCGADCASGLCVPNPYDQFAGECSQVCGPNADCPGVDSCIQVSVPGPSQNCPPAGLPFDEGDIISVCAVNETGIPCNTGENCTIGGTCYPPPNPIPGQVDVQAACAAPCARDAECPVGFTCQGIQTDAGQVVNVCAPEAQVFVCPDGSNGSCGGVCRVGPGEDEVNVSHCIVLAPNQPGYCSCSCNSAAQCPAGYACSRNVIDTQDPARPGICLPISGYTCPLGNDSCLSLACVGQLEAELISRCTAPCTNQNDCPANYECMQIPNEPGRYCVANPQAR